MIPKKKADLCYGKSGTGKTSCAVGGLVKFIHRRYGKKTRLLCLDGGGYGPIDYLEDMGWLDVTDLSGAGDPISAINRITTGWWWDGQTWIKPPIPSDVGALAIEGIYSMGKFIMEYLLTEPGIRLPEQPKDCMVPTSDKDLKYGFSGRSHYQFIQQRMYKFIIQSGQLPLEKVLWTSMEKLGIDEETGVPTPIIGPQLIGKAETANSPQWFANIFHLDNSITRRNKETGEEEQEFRLWLKPHRNLQNGSIYPAKLRVPPDIQGEVSPYLVMEKEENGFVSGLDVVYEEELRLKQMVREMLEREATTANPPAPLDEAKGGE